MIVKVSEIDPICAMQACMDGFEIVSPYKNGENTGETKASLSEWRQPYLLSFFDLVTESFTLIAGTLSEPASNISNKR
jgi:hypothetical protein